MALLGLLETDTLYDDLILDYGSYGQMFADFFNKLNGALDYRYYQVQDGELPQSPSECDAYLITGSKAGVYDNLPWIEPLQAWIRDFHAQKAKIIGICFGHQIIAHSLGGFAAKSDQGWGVGVLSTEQTFTANHPAYNSALRLIHSHQDQVIKLPASATRRAGSAFCPNAAMSIDDTVLTFQAHPEFSPVYLQRLLERRKEKIGLERFQQALASLAQPTDHEWVGRYLLDFIKLKVTVKSH